MGKRCVHKTAWFHLSDNPLCGGTPKDLSQPLYDSMKECCKQKFSWMGDSCMCKADPSLAICVEAATKWYASDKENGKCKRNCDTSDDDNIDLQYIFHYALSLYLNVFIGH